MSDDLFLAQYAGDVGANHVAKHDLRFTGKNAGENRVKKLQEAGVWDKLIDHVNTHDRLKSAWIEAFGSNSEKEFLAAWSAEHDHPPHHSPEVTPC
jgi:hypothetical protein